jgi:pimeloyl-ACP methyl ester carboxylesterase
MNPWVRHFIALKPAFANRELPANDIAVLTLLTETIMTCRISSITKVLLLLLVAFVSDGFAQTPQEEQIWEGTMEVAPGASITMQVRTRVEGDTFKATLRKVNPDGPKMDVNQFKITDDKQVQLAIEVGEMKAEFEGALNDAGDEIVGTWKQLGREIPLTLVQKAKLKLVESWKGTLTDGPKKLEFQFRILESSTGATVARFDSLSEKKMDWNAQAQRDDKTLLFRVPELNVAFVGTFDESGEKAIGEWVAESGRLPMEFERTNDAATAPQLPPASRPQTPDGPFPYEVVEVKFENVPDGVSLAGTLTFPRNEKLPEAKYPAVVLISGSGPQDRDETIYDHKPFLVIADQLTRAGIAVLRFDDRGVGKSTGDFSSSTSADFANDVLAGLQFLQQHKNIDKQNIGLIGHSEGGLIAPMVAANNPDDVAFIVLMAGPGVNGYEILRDQGKRIAEAEGIPAAEIAKESALRDAVALAVRNAPEIVDGDLVVQNAIDQFVSSQPLSEQDAIRPTAEQVAAFKQLATPWFRFFLRYEPSSSLRNVRCPVLAINGELDLQVWHKTNLNAVVAALKAGGNTRFRAVQLPRLNHLFQRAQTGAVSEYNEIEQTIASEALDLMRTWIIKQVSDKAMSAKSGSR